MEQAEIPHQRLTQSLAWKKLQSQRKSQANLVLTDLFACDPKRFENFSLKFEGLLYDFSKHLLTEETLALLIDLAHAANLGERIDAMFAGDLVNTTECRPALHTALRAEAGGTIYVDGQDIMPGISAVKEKMREISGRLRAGLWLGSTGKPIKTVVNLGVGGSDLGPRMVCEAFKHKASDHVELLFVSSIDGNEVVATLRNLNPETTLFIISSKSFTTTDTMANADTVKSWLRENLGDTRSLANHFIGVSADAPKMSDFGIDAANQIPLWDWVGGRYSVWSAVGISIAISLGMNDFEQFLAGANTADQHFRYTEWRRNIPVVQALIGIWYNNFWQADTQAVLPYDHRLHVLPAFLQQLQMESNGKSVTLDHKFVDYATAPIIWGEFGPNAQHAFYQLLHQSTRFVPIEFIAVADNASVPEKHRELALVNCLAQSRALMFGGSIAEGRDKEDALIKNYPGNKPSTTILMKELTPRTLGSLIACYEHKVFVQSVIWNINPFDQWGVELGKKLAGQLRNNGNKCFLADEVRFDSSTHGLLEFAGYHHKQQNK